MTDTSEPNLPSSRTENRTNPARFPATDRELQPSVYVHIPFCEQRCYYCAFTVAVSPSPAWEPYVRRVLREIDLSGFDSCPETIYFGGGTPSLIAPDSIAELLSRFSGAAREITIEANPGLSLERIRRYRDMGINRISLGAQSLEDEDLHRAGRLHSARNVIEDFTMLRQSGFDNVNLDLIAGLPRQSFDTWARNIEKVIQLGPDHVSVYVLDAEERSVWGRHPSSATDDEFVRFYMHAALRLEAAGYSHYEISNWALPGRECLHNLRYWDGGPYRGFGVSAHSHETAPARRRFWNTPSLPDYQRSIDSGMLPIEEEILTPAMRLEEAFMLGLRRISGCNVDLIAKELNISYPREWYVRVRDLEQAGLVDFDGTTLKLRPAGWMLASAITEEVLCPTLTSTFEAIQ